MTHIPVMLQQVLDVYRSHSPNGRNAMFVDATLGAGGHAAAVLEEFPNCRLVGFDQDAQARTLAMENLVSYTGRFRIIPENFRCLACLAEEKNWPGADGVLFDLGVSNMQLTTPERGFSYQDEGPLDMRMDREGDAPSAADLLSEMDIGGLTRIFREYGEERYAYQIAKAIVRHRERGNTLVTTADLTNLIRSTLPAPVQRKMGTHPARRVFQGLRIAINSELDVLSEGLEGALQIASNGGSIVVISYHSLEDRIVKRTFLKWANAGMGKVVTKRPLIPDDQEIIDNRSSRSAKLRVFSVFHSN